MGYQDWLNIGDASASILTAAVAAVAYGRHMYERHRKRLRLERYLKDQKNSDIDRGQRNLAHLGAQVGMSETDIMDSAFRSRHIHRNVHRDENGKAIGILLEYKP